jgi:hypothetical protein
MVSPLFKECPAFYVTRRSIVVFKTEATVLVLSLCISHLQDATCHAHLLLSLKSKYFPRLPDLNNLNMHYSFMKRGHATSHTKQVKLYNFVCFSKYDLDIRRKEKP